MTPPDQYVGRIYDCAANPALWAETLTAIRDELDAAYVMVGVTDIAPLLRGEMPKSVFKTSPWDVDQLAAVGRFVQTVPGFEQLFSLEIDRAWMQMQHCSEAEFHQSPFYKNWAGPQKLRDSMSVPIIRRPSTAGLVTVASFEERPLFEPRDADFLAELAPHIRRAIAISDLVDQGNLATILFRNVLDALATAVVIVGQGQRIVFANGAAEAMLSEGHLLTGSNGVLATSRPGPSALALEDAIARAGRGDAAIGIKGIGVPLAAATGERAAAYVLPIAGRDLRAALGRGYCAVFVARRDEQLPVMMEVLRTVYDLTQAEARVAGLVANGDGVEAIAAALGVSSNTVRSQIKSALAKTGTHSQVELAAAVRSLVPPV